MKWSSILSLPALCALAFLGNACEKHPATELPAEDREGTPYASEAKAEGHATAEGAGSAEGAKHEAAHAGAAPHEEAGAAPKFFPEKK